MRRTGAVALAIATLVALPAGARAADPPAGAAI